MIQRVHLQPAYILHYRPYRDTSLIMDIFSEDYGYISAIAQGARSARSALKGLLQPFTPLLLSWSGKTELMRLNNAEARGLPHTLVGNRLISGLYINELLLRTLHKFDPHPQLYHFYTDVLAQLSEYDIVQPILRIFERDLLNELGYAINLASCAKSGRPINAQLYYQFNPAHGAIELTIEQVNKVTKDVFAGDSLLALANGKFTTQQHLRDAKRLMRLALHPVIGDKPLKSRELLIVTNSNQR